MNSRIKYPRRIMVAAALVLAGCAATEQSVRPGVNAEYKGADIDRWVERFESESREIFRERVRIAEAAGIEPGMSVADVGAGTGAFTAIFSQAVGAAGKVYCEDIKPEFLDRIKRIARVRGLSSIETVLGTEHDARLPANAADLVFVCDTYHHFEFPRGMMGSVHRGLKPGGMLVIVDFERLPGRSRQWVLDHVRAGKEEVQREIESFGFEYLDQPATPFLTENYMLRFRKK